MCRISLSRSSSPSPPSPPSPPATLKIRFPTIFACLYGDQAAQSVGHPALGLPPRVGYAIAVVAVLNCIDYTLHPTPRTPPS
ncbi:MAG: hypothetical protein MJA27_28695 [Pseudanabaenales cyanobacterium]|nr:hypothetical protein [Pseudanabaenales cyanobacterium]